MLKAVSGIRYRIEDYDVYPDFYPTTYKGNIELIEETIENKLTRLSKYLTFLGLKYKILIFLEEAKEFEKLVYNGLKNSHLNLYENADMLGFNYYYGYANNESITKFVIGLNLDGLDRELSLKLFKTCLIINTIYYENVLKNLGDLQSNILFMLKLNNTVISIEELECEGLVLSNKIGLKLGKFSDSKEFIERVKSNIVGDSITISRISFIDKAYHTDFLIQLG